MALKKQLLLNVPFGVNALWDGMKSLDLDMTLSGCIMGMTLHTRPEHIFRHWWKLLPLAQKIIETYREHGVIVESLCFTGGIPTKNPWLVQVYTDVLGLPVTVLEDSVSATLGSAITAAVAAGTEMGGYATLADATAAMAAKRIKAYSPNPLRTVVHEQLYREYMRLHDYLGIGNESIMKQLRKIKEGTGRD